MILKQPTDSKSAKYKTYPQISRISQISQNSQISRFSHFSQKFHASMLSPNYHFLITPMTYSSILLKGEEDLHTFAFGVESIGLHHVVDGCERCL